MNVQRVLAATLGALVGLWTGFAGLSALVVSRGTLSDWVVIGTGFFTTLPASVLGVLWPRFAGVVLLAAACIAAVGLLIDDASAAATFALMFGVPTVVVGLAFLTSRGEQY